MNKKMLALLGAGVATGALLGTEKGAQVRKKVANGAKKFAGEVKEAAEEKYEEVKENVKGRVKEAKGKILGKVKTAALTALGTEEKVHAVVKTVLEKASHLADEGKATRTSSAGSRKSPVKRASRTAVALKKKAGARKTAGARTKSKTAARKTSRTR